MPERPVGVTGKGSGGGEKVNSKHDDVYVRKCHDETYCFAWCLKKLKSSGPGLLSEALAYKKYR